MSTLQESGFHLASVVRVTNRLAWSKLAIDEPLAQLHVKFLGKSMVDEEQDWRNSQPRAIPAVGGELGGEDQCMDVDVDEVDGSIIPGCYILNIDVDGLDFSKIWVRADYIRVYDFLERRHSSPSVPKGRAPSVILTGEPGIGKSVWVYYALRRRLAERKPVIWYREHSCYLFVEEGVYEAPSGFKPSYFHTFVWTLVDADEGDEGVPSHLVSHGTRLFVIYSTSPHKERWSRLHKTVRDITVIMNPWTRQEISYAASIHLPKIADHERINHIYDRLGPTPRLCIDFLFDPVKLTQYEDDVRKAVSNITPNRLEQLFKDASSLTLDAISHKICLISRENQENVASLPIVKPITPSIQSRLAGQFRTLERREQIRLYKCFAKIPDSMGVAGVAFEAAAQLSLQDEMELELIPMVHLAPSQDDRLPRWYSSHVLLRNESLESSRQQALQQALTIHIKPSQTFQYTDDGPSSIESGVYYLPELSNQVAFDAFILLNGILYIFQFTIGEEHDIKPGLVDFSATCRNIPSMDKWRFVFIVPPSLTLICPQPWLLKMRRLQPYSAVIAL